MKEKVHLIAIGGSVMHNLALALNNQGFTVSGSDDQIFEPAKSRLESKGICPEKEGWFPDKINENLSLVILGMHAKGDNPELIRALELDLKLQSFPEFIAEQFANQERIVIAGSHGKTSTTSMLMHVFKELNKSFDYLVGAQLDGFNEMVSLTNAQFSIIEGDEYLSSCLDLRPKFLHYRPKFAIITGIAWDHYNVFPTYELYVQSFIDFIESMPRNGTLVYYDGDNDLVKIVHDYGAHLHCIPYHEADYIIQADGNYLLNDKACYKLEIFGKHNFQNLNAVLKICKVLEFDENLTCQALSSFKGAAKRLELIYQDKKRTVYQDFAHAPSKVKATMNAIRENFPDKNILCFLELHTYSSLNKNFIVQYKNSLKEINKAIIFYDKKALEIKKMEIMSDEFIQDSFGSKEIEIVNDAEKLKQLIQSNRENYDLTLFLGSGNWGGNDIKSLSI
ncbi:MAG: Mur ligase family protein [Saprospiraceae bacterium]